MSGREGLAMLEALRRLDEANLTDHKKLAATIFLKVRRFIRELADPGLNRRRCDRNSKAASLSRRSGGRFNPKAPQRHKQARK